MYDFIQDLTLQEVSNAKILLVDDEKMNTAILAKSLYMFPNISRVHSGPEAIEFCKNSPPDLVILDIVMPNLNGLETCKIIKKLPLMQNCPVIFSTSLQSIEDELACWEAGGSDFINKPVTPMTLLKRIMSHIQLKLKYDQQQKLAYFDSLTKLGNKRYYDDFYKEQMLLASRSKTDLSLVVLDVDYFKAYNDNYGHKQGDKCLISIAGIIKSELNRPTDSAMRYGGEEFALILPNTDIKGAQFVARKIISNIKNEKIQHSGSPYNVVTISAGVSSLKTINKGFDLFDASDKQLYLAKESGRNMCA